MNRGTRWRRGCAGTWRGRDPGSPRSARNGHHRSPCCLWDCSRTAATRAWRLDRWFWVVASASAVLLVLFCTLVLGPEQRSSCIVFGGDGGGLVLGTMLMLTVYAREEHPIRRDHLRWGLLVVGALAFMDAYAVWSGPIAPAAVRREREWSERSERAHRDLRLEPAHADQPLWPACARVSRAAGGCVCCGALR